MNRALTCLAILAVPLSGTGQIPEESFGALAVGETYGYGGTVMASTPAEADEDAMSMCGTVDPDCSIVARFGSRDCVSVFVDEQARAIGWATGPGNSEEILIDSYNACLNVGGRICRPDKYACNGASDYVSLVTVFNGGEELWAPPADEVCEAVSQGDQPDYCWVAVVDQPDCWVFTEFLFFGRPVGTVNWLGDCPRGQAQGSGTAEWEWTYRGRTVNSIDQGTYTDGKRHGEWTHEIPETGYRMRIMYEDGVLVEEQPL